MPQPEHGNTIETCLALAEDTRRLGQQIVDETREHITGIAEDPDRHKDIFQQVRAYNENFEKFREIFDALTREKKFEAANADQQKALVGALESLSACNKDMTEVIESIKVHTGQRLGVLGKARGIFEKFIKVPEGVPPRFFDKKG